jgi:hypothetical protein
MNSYDGAKAALQKSPVQVRYAAPIGAVLGAVSGAGQRGKWCGLRCGIGAEFVCVGTPIPPVPTARLWLSSAHQISALPMLIPFPLKFAQGAGGSP